MGFLKKNNNLESYIFECNINSDVIIGCIDKLSEKEDTGNEEDTGSEVPGLTVRCPCSRAYREMSVKKISLRGIQSGKNKD